MYCGESRSLDDSHNSGLMPVFLSISPRQTHVMFSTSTPSAVQRIPWPTDVTKTQSTRPEEEDGAANKWIGHDTWFLGANTDLTWLAAKDGEKCIRYYGERPLIDFISVNVVQIAHSRPMGAELWITSDGRAYFVQLYRVDDDELESTGDLDNGTENAGTTTATNSIGVIFQHPDFCLLF